MKRIIALLLIVFGLASTVRADFVFSTTTGQTLYVRINRTGDTAFDLTEGSALKLGQYTATDATIIATGLPAGEYSYRIFVGTAGAQTNTDVDVGFGTFNWNGGTVSADAAASPGGEDLALENTATAIASTGTTVATTRAPCSRLSAARASYLDALQIGGLVASGNTIAQLVSSQARSRQ